MGSTASRSLLRRSPGRVLAVLAGGLMVIDTLLAWQSIDIGSLTFTRNAWHGFWGVLVGVLSIAFFANSLVLADIIGAPIRLPHRLFALLIAPVTLVAAVVKMISDDFSGWASYVGILLAAAMTYAAWLIWNEPKDMTEPEPAPPPEQPTPTPEPAGAPTPPGEPSPPPPGTTEPQSEPDEPPGNR